MRGNPGDPGRAGASATLDDPADAEITSIIPIDWDSTDWDSGGLMDTADRAPGPVDDIPRRRSLPVDATQDILIAECEFDDAPSEHSFDIRDYYDPDVAGRTPATSPSSSRHRGRHRLAAPPHALKGRAALLAVAAGAAVVAATGQIDTSTHNDATVAPEPAQPVNPAAAVGPADPSVNGDSGVAQNTPPADMHEFTDQLAAGDALARDNAEADRKSRLPLFSSPVSLGAYQFTSGFAYRWGAFHGGVDFAAPLGTSIHAATDGVVIEAGPASGYGNWVQVQAPDGTVTMYGHMATSGVNVRKGEHVTAGQVIAHVGSEGFSTGPHCHFEVWKNGKMKIDPMPWLAAHGIVMSTYTG